MYRSPPSSTRFAQGEDPPADRAGPVEREGTAHTGGAGASGGGLAFLDPSGCARRILGPPAIGHLDRQDEKEGAAFARSASDLHVTAQQFGPLADTAQAAAGSLLHGGRVESPTVVGDGQAQFTPDETQIHPGLRVVIVTAHGTERDRQACMETGATAFLNKPVDLTALARFFSENGQQLQ